MPAPPPDPTALARDTQKDVVRLVAGLSRLLRDARKEKQITQTELARRVGTSQCVISRFESLASLGTDVGESGEAKGETPSLITLAKIARALDMRLTLSASTEIVAELAEEARMIRRAFEKKEFDLTKIEKQWAEWNARLCDALSELGEMTWDLRQLFVRIRGWKDQTPGFRWHIDAPIALMHH